MTLLTDEIVQHEQHYSPLESACCYFVPEVQLNDLAKKIKKPPLRGKNMNHFHSRGAQALAALALALGEKKNTAVVAIYFHDCDGSNTSPSTRLEDLYCSMQHRGFQVFGLKSGVPMIPKPKSEAWLICALKKMPYQNCAQLESASGNDDSPNSLKKQLATCLDQRALSGTGDLRQVLNDLIHPPEGYAKLIDFTRIDMPSFTSFRKDLEQAIRLDDVCWKEACDPPLLECVKMAARYLDAV